MQTSITTYDDKPHEECGVFGIFDRQAKAALEVYYGLFPCSTAVRKALA